MILVPQPSNVSNCSSRSGSYNVQLFADNLCQKTERTKMNFIYFAWSSPLVLNCNFPKYVLKHTESYNLGWCLTRTRSHHQISFINKSQKVCWNKEIFSANEDSFLLQFEKDFLHCTFGVKGHSHLQYFKEGGCILLKKHFREITLCFCNASLVHRLRYATLMDHSCPFLVFLFSSLPRNIEKM